MIADIWSFLQTPANQTTLAFLGGGAMVFISGLWTAIGYVHKRKKLADPPDKGGPSRQTHAQHGVAAGGNMTVGGDVNVQQLPKTALVLGVLGLVILGVAAWNAGERTTVSNGSYVGGDMIDSPVTIESHGEPKP